MFIEDCRARIHMYMWEVGKKDCLSDLFISGHLWAEPADSGISDVGMTSDLQKWIQLYTGILDVLLC